MKFEWEAREWREFFAVCVRSEKTPLRYSKMENESVDIFAESVDGAPPNYKFIAEVCSECFSKSANPLGPDGTDGVRRLFETFLGVGALEDDADRVRFVYGRLMPGRGFRPPPLPSPIPEKSDERSGRLRAEGNAEFGRRNYRRALELYSSALAHAPLDSATMRRAFGNRSAALFRLRERDACLLDADRALALLPEDAPDRDGFKLKMEKRKRDCGELPERRPEPTAVPNIVRYRMPCASAHIAPPKETKAGVPCASAALQIGLSRRADRFGRFVVAARDIPIGETVVLEEPHALFIVKSERHRRCRGCGRPNDAMLPCDGCSRAMFCDERCKSAARETHDFECPLVAALDGLGFDDSERFALLTALKAKAAHASWDEFKRAVREIETVENPLFKGFVSIPDEKGVEMKVFDSKTYASAHALKTNPKKLDSEELLGECFTASMMLYLLKYHTTFFADCPEDVSSIDANYWFFGGLLVHNLMTSSINLQRLYYASEFLMTDFAVGLYPFSSLINHSCAANVCTVTVGVKIANIAIRPIKKGQKLYKNYAPYFIAETRKDLRAYLKDYKIKCRCEACSNNWPILKKWSENSQLVNGRIVNNPAIEMYTSFLKTDVSLIEKFVNGDKIAAQNILNKLYSDATALDSYYLCSVTTQYQFLIQLCWMLCGNVPISD